jgi:dethiobiotin synthetase
MIPGLFVTATATASGKTFVTRALTRALRQAGGHPAALKPIETGIAPDPVDALALARACARPELACASGLFRDALPLAPYAISLETGRPPPDPDVLAARTRELARGADTLLVEGAGGLLVPLSSTTTIADLARALALPMLVVAPNQLGVLSSVLTCLDSARQRHLPIAAVVLVDHRCVPADPSTRTNRRILQERLDVPVLAFPHCADDDDVLANAARSHGLLALLSSS